MKHEYKPVSFFLVTFLLAWGFGFSGAYFSFQTGLEAISRLLIIASLFSPVIALLLVTDRAKKEEIWKRLHVRKLKRNFVILLLLLPVVLLLATTLSLAFGFSCNQFALSRELYLMKGEGLLSLFLLFLAPVVEEIGWRGYGVDSIRSRCNLLNTSLLFSFLWAMWHLPLFFMNGYYHHAIWDMSFVYVINFFVSCVAVTFLMNWIFYTNYRNIPAAIVLHFILNLSFVSFQTEQFTKCIATALFAVVAGIVITKNKELFFKNALTE